MSPWVVLAMFAVMTLAGALGGAVGFGANLVAAPLLTLVDPSLVPGPLSAVNIVLQLLVLRRERVPGAWLEARWPLIGQLPGTVAGVALLSVVAVRDVSVLVGALTLLAVAISIARLHPRRTPVTLTAAGVVSGITGGASSISGPPVALLYQGATGPEIRGALSRYFMLSAVWTVVVLTAFGRFDLASMGKGVLLLPGAFVGYRISGRLLRRLERRHIRTAILVLSTVSSAVAIARGLGQ